MRALLRRIGRSTYVSSTRARLAVVAGVVTFAVLAGTGASFAYWTASATATGSAKAAALSVTTANFSTVGFTYGNEALSTTGSVSFTSTTNTSSTQAMTVTATFQTAASATLAGLVGITVWSTTSAANCAAGPGSAATVTGTWASPVTASATVTAAAPTAVFCVRSSIASRETVATSAGGFTFQPRVTGSLSIGNFVAATAATDTATQSTRYIYPVGPVSRYNWYSVKPINTTNSCMDVSGGGASGSGTQVISWGCKTTDLTNQRWQFLPAPTTGYVEIKPQNSQSLRADSGSVTVTTDTNAVSQQWQMQLVSAGVYQIVSLATGYCLTAPAGTGDNAGSMFMAVCDNRDRQKFTLGNETLITMTGLTCTETGNARTNYTVTYSWATTNDNGPYTVQARRATNQPWVTLATSATGAFTAPVPYGSEPTTVPWGYNTSYTVQVLDAGGNQVATTTVTIERSRASIFSDYVYYLRCP